MAIGLGLAGLLGGVGGLGAGMSDYAALRQQQFANQLAEQRLAQEADQLRQEKELRTRALDIQEQSNLNQQYFLAPKAQLPSEYASYGVPQVGRFQAPGDMV